MKKTVKFVWGCVPVIFFLICVASVVIVQETTGDTLRIVPRNVLMCIGGGSLGIFLLWGNIKYTAFSKRLGKSVFHIAEIIIKIFSISIFLIFVFGILFVMGYTHQPEHVVTRNGIKMVASVHSFLDECVYYYQYKNPFFYGKELGYEYYGNGGGDPLVRIPKPDPIRWTFYDLSGNIVESGFKDSASDSVSKHGQAFESLQDAPHEIMRLNFTAVENDEKQRSFPVLIDDFASAYNRHYDKDCGENFFQTSSQWKKFNPTSKSHWGQETCCYRFQKDSNTLSEPTISMYVSKDDGYIKEITLDFDDHGYTKWAYELYQQECYYTLKTFFPDDLDYEVIKLRDDLFCLAYDDTCFVTEEEDIVPQVLYYEGDIGIYAYYAAGMAHICIIPVTQSYLDELVSGGTEVNEIPQ